MVLYDKSQDFKFDPKNKNHPGQDGPAHFYIPYSKVTCFTAYDLLCFSETSGKTQGFETLVQCFDPIPYLIRIQRKRWMHKF